VRLVSQARRVIQKSTARLKARRRVHWVIYFRFWGRRTARVRVRELLSKGLTDHLLWGKDPK